MTYWCRDFIITLGGFDGSSDLNEVQQFVVKKNKWKALPCLPEKIGASAATVLNDVLYNIGGMRSTNSVCWLDLLSESSKWNSVKTLGQTDFSGYHLRDATVVKNKIVYFGSRSEKATYVLEKGEEEGKLEVRSRFKGIDYERGDYRSSFCTY